MDCNKIANALHPSASSSPFEMTNSSLYASSNEHMVQKRIDQPYLPSFPSEYFPGVINPLKRRTIRQMLNVDTKFRENYETTLSTNFNVVLPMTYNSIYSMQLSAIELPLTYNLISEKYGNNYFYICEGNIENKNNPVSNFVTVTIPDGNYFLNINLIEAINNAISATIYSGKIIFELNPNADSKTHVYATDPSFEFTLIFQTAANQTYMTTASSFTTCSNARKGTANANANPSVVGTGFHLGKNLGADQLPYRFGWVIGFRKGVYTSQSSYTAEATVDVRFSNYLYLVVDDFNNNVNNGFFSAFRSSVLNKNILARISVSPNDSNPYLYSPGELVQNNLRIITTPREYFGPVNITSLNIQLLDSLGRVIDLNSMDFSFCLTLTKQYDL